MSIRKIAFEIVFLVFLSTFFPVPIIAQNGMEMSARGFVKNVETDEPLTDVEIIIVREEQGEYTDVFIETTGKNGFFKFRFLEAGNYHFRVKPPGLGILGTTLEGKDFDRLDIVEGKNVFLKVFLGESKNSIFEKSVSLDGTEITVKILYDKWLHQVHEELRKEDICSAGYDGLQILGPQIYEVEDKIVLRDSDGNICEAILIYGPSIFGNDKIQCDSVEGKCYCSFKNLTCTITVILMIHKRTYFENLYSTVNQECIDCKIACVYEHENTHLRLMNEYIQENWNKSKKKLNSEVTSYCCDDTEACDGICRGRALIESLEFNKLYKTYAAKTEDEAMKVYDNCITQKCHKIKTCDKLK